MPFRKGRLFGNGMIVLGVTLILFSIVMPNYKVSGNLNDSGPHIAFESNRPYLISTYITPPIDRGTLISLNLLSSRPNATAVLLAPFDPNQDTIETPVLLNSVFGPNQRGLVYFTTAPSTSQYMLMITSYNSTFEFRFASVWSPFFEFRGLIVFGLLALPVGVVALYYDELVEKRERMFEKALKGIPPPLDKPKS